MEVHFLNHFWTLVKVLSSNVLGELLLHNGQKELAICLCSSIPYSVVLIDNDVELVWDQLTGEEREEFQKMLKDGRIGHLLDSYTPWWKVSTSIP